MAWFSERGMDEKKAAKRGFFFGRESFGGKGRTLREGFIPHGGTRPPLEKILSRRGQPGKREICKKRNGGGFFRASRELAALKGGKRDK